MTRGPGAKPGPSRTRGRWFRVSGAGTALPRGVPPVRVTRTATRGSRKRPRYGPAPGDDGSSVPHARRGAGAVLEAGYGPNRRAVSHVACSFTRIGHLAFPFPTVPIRLMALPAHFLELVYDALLKSFWRKPALKRFLRRCGIDEPSLAQLDHEETKRQWLDRLFPQLERTDKGRTVINRMARELADQTAFPDLQNWEDSTEKIRAAREAVSALQAYLHRQDEDRQHEKDAAERRRMAAQLREKTIRSQTDLTKLRERLDALCSRLGTQDGGYAFQDWFYDLMDFSEIDHRRPYTTAGRQVDGSITVDGTTYLVELKFTAEQSGATDIDSLVKKVNDKADNTMGIMVSMSGYSSVAVQEASFSKSPLLLLDHSHLYLVLTGAESFKEVVRRVRRHSSQEGKAYLSTEDFGGR